MCKSKVCPICGEKMRKNEQVVRHPYMSYSGYPIYVHADCYDYEDADTSDLMYTSNFSL